MEPDIEDWAGIDAEIEQIVVGSDEPVTLETTGNTRDFVALARVHCPCPDGIGKGYWNTVRIWWGNLEFEIFGDRIEVYRFYDERTDIREILHNPGEPFPADLLAESPLLHEQQG